MKRIRLSVSVFFCAAFFFSPAFPAAIAADDAVPRDALVPQEKPLETLSDLPAGSRMALFNAQGYLDQEKYEEAVEEIRGYLERNPDKDHYLIRFFMANALNRFQKHEEAMAEYEATVALEPRHKQGWLNLGEVAYNLGDYERAAEAISRGFELSPDKPTRLLYYSAVAYLLAEKPDRAAPVLEQLASGAYGEPELDWFKALISVYLTLEDAGKGESTVAAMLERYPNDPDAWHVAFQYAASVSDYKQAAVALTITGYLRDLSREERMQLGDLYSTIKDPIRAAGFYHSALVDSGSTKELERLASSYIAAYDTKAALATIERAIVEEPSARLYSLKGDLHYIERDYAGSYEAFKTSAELDPQSGRAYLMLGYCAIELARYDEAIEKLQLAAGFPEQEETALLLIKRARLMLANDRDVARSDG